MLEDWPEELRSSLIKGGANAYLYFIRELGGYSNEDLSSVRGHRWVDLCSMVNPFVDSAKGGNSG